MYKVGKFGPSLYYAHDKSVHDALHHKKVTSERLRSFLRGRGVYVSASTPKDELIGQASMMLMDYFDFNEIVSWIETTSRKEKKSNKIVQIDESGSEKLDLEEICREVKKGAKNGEKVRVKKVGESVFLSVSYSEHDYSKAELRQKVTKEVNIEISKEGGGIKIRKPQNKKASFYEAEIINRVKEKVDDELEEKEISLSHIASPEARTKFFVRLVDAIEGYEVDNISQIRTNHENNDDEEGSHLSGIIKKAAFSGSDVLQTKEFSQLCDEGFYITSIVWTAESEIPNGDLVELEAEFSDPENCNHFCYKLRGVYPYSDRKSQHSITRRKASALEEKDILLKIESASMIALDSINDEFGSTDGNED